MTSSPTPPARWFGIGMLVLAAGLAANTVLGPLVLGAIEYPFTETVYNETLGLEAVSLVLVAPFAAAAGALSLVGHRAGPPLALGPTAFGAYMLVQYILGPQYATYQPSIAFHLALFILSGALLLRAAVLSARIPLPIRSVAWGWVVLAMAAFVVSRWLPALAGMVSREPVPAAAADLTMYWSIFLLDLGIVVPLSLAVAVALLYRHPLGETALYGVVGWFALVPPSVAAMSAVKLLRDDPNAVAGDTLMFAAVSIVYALIAVLVYRPLFRSAVAVEVRGSLVSVSSRAEANARSGQPRPVR